MSAQLSDLISQIREVSRDDLSSPVVSDSSIQSYVGYAVDWVATRHPAKKRETLALVDGEATVTGGFIMISGVYAENTSFERSLLEQDGPWPDDDMYVIIDEETLRVGSDLAQVEVYYTAAWRLPLLPTDILETPRQFDEPILLYAVSRCLSQMAVSTADVSQWNTKADSGNPEHNPLLKVSAHYMAQAEAALNRVIPR